MCVAELPKVGRRNFIKGAAAATAALSIPHLYTPEAHAQEKAASIDCPIIMVHEASTQLVQGLVRTYVDAQGRTPVTVSNLTDMLNGDMEKPAEKLCAFTFDDRLFSQYSQAVPYLFGRGIPATFYVMAPGWPGDGVHSYMKDSHLSELAAIDFFELGSHTINHPQSLPVLRSANYGSYLSQIDLANNRLINLIQEAKGTDDEMTLTFAYPYGVYNQAVANDVSRFYKSAVTTVAGSIQRSNQLFEMTRIRAS